MGTEKKDSTQVSGDQIEPHKVREKRVGEKTEYRTGKWWQTELENVRTGKGVGKTEEGGGKQNGGGGRGRLDPGAGQPRKRERQDLTCRPDCDMCPGLLGVLLVISLVQL